MIDIAELNEPGLSEWQGVMTSWRKQQPINKQEVIGLLRSGVPVPSNAAEFLAEVLEGEYKFQRGNKPWYPEIYFIHKPPRRSRIAVEATRSRSRARAGDRSPGRRRATEPQDRRAACPTPRCRT